MPRQLRASIDQRRRRTAKLAQRVSAGVENKKTEPRRGGTKIFLSALAILLFASVTAGHAQLAPQTPADNFTDRTASTLLRQLSESLQGHSQKKFLALFDLSMMKNGPAFQQQISSFFSQTDSIAIHLYLAETNIEGQNPTMAVDAEMEVQPSNGGLPLRRKDRLSFAVARSGKSWKFIDVRPRSFFSLP